MSFNFDKLTTEIVADWTLGTLEEWLEGWTMPQDDVPIQYRARPQGDGTWLFEPTPFSNDGRQRPDQRFEIRISVTEVQP